MTGCAGHDDLVGGYVLGALEPAEMEWMRRHVESCPACGLEARRLAGLPALLDRVEPADVPPPVIAPEVEEAVLDRFARERRRVAGPPRRRARLVVVAAALCAAALAPILVMRSSGDEASDRSYATARLAAVDAGSSARATAYADAVPAGTRVTLGARGLTRPRGAVYELWCVRADGGWVSGGTFRADTHGRAQAELTAAVEPGDYHIMVVTRRSELTSEEARGTPILRGELRY